MMIFNVLFYFIFFYKKLYSTDVYYYKNLTLDVYYNERDFKNETKLPVIIFIHGGFWLNGKYLFFI